MDASISFWGLTVYPYGVWAAAGALLTLGLMGILGYKRRLPAGTVRVFGLTGVVLGLFCARLFFCAFNLDTFTETYGNFWLTLRFFDGGLSMTGLLCGLTLAALMTARVMNVRFGQVLDVLATALALLLACLRLGEGYTELGVGKVVEESALTAAAPWLFIAQKAGVNVEYRMAVCRYEAAAALILLAVMLCLFFRFHGRRALRPGDLALIFFTLYGASQTLLESLRDDGHMLITFLRVGQLAAAFMPLIAAGIFSKRYRHLNPEGWRRVLWTWIGLTLCVAGLVLLEFSLDGRLSWGAPSMGRDYAIMAGLCALMAALPCGLCATLNRRLYREERFQVKVNQA